MKRGVANGRDLTVPSRSFTDANASTVEFEPPSREPLGFHQRLPEYAPTPLIEAPQLANKLGVGRVWVKDESSRLGLPSFKILGASWAVYRALAERLGRPPRPWHSLDQLAEQLVDLRPLTLSAATDGNHGRAVAHMAALLGLAANIYVPSGTAEARIAAIESEGASVKVVKGTYDDAVKRSAQDASDRCLVVPDTSWAGEEQVPRWVIDGYATIFLEIDDQLASLGKNPPEVVFVQIGVGALAAATVRHYRRTGVPRPIIVGVEPIRAACVLASMRAGRILTIPGPHDSIMAGLNCGTPSNVAWPAISTGIDLYLAIEDERARDGMRLLSQVGLTTGESGAAGIGALLALQQEHDQARQTAGIELDESATILLLLTEGATDPHAYREIVGDTASTAL